MKNQNSTMKLGLLRLFGIAIFLMINVSEMYALQYQWISSGNPIIEIIITSSDLRLEDIKKLEKQYPEYINKPNNEGVTVLMLAASGVSSESEKIVKYLVEKGVSVNAEDHFKRTVLHWAARSGTTNIIRELLANGAIASLNDKNSDGETPLQEAIYLTNVDAVKFLVEHGADISIKNVYGETALDFARLFQHDPNFKEKKKKFDEIVDYLRKRQKEQGLRNLTFKKYYHKNSH